MEIMGSPPRDIWIRFKGVPLHVWREETFSLLGDCVGSTVEVDSVMTNKEMLLFGWVKVARDVNQSIPKKVSMAGGSVLSN